MKSGRMYAIESDEFPIALVYQGDETSAVDDVNSKKTRELEIRIEIHAIDNPADMSSPELQSDLNGLAEEIENAIEADPSIGGLALFVEHQGTQTTLAQVDTDRGGLLLNLVAQYRTARLNASQLA